MVGALRKRYSPRTTSSRRFNLHDVTALSRFRRLDDEISSERSEKFFEFGICDTMTMTVTKPIFSA
jgi:hypothetical protein